MAQVFQYSYASASPKSVMQHYVTNQRVVCTYQPGNTSTRASLEHEVIEWCIKACEVHGFEQDPKHYYDVSDTIVRPALPISDVGEARKITPGSVSPL